MRPGTLVHQVLIAAQKARSNVAEVDDALEPTPLVDPLWALLDPTLFGDGPLNIMAVCERVLDRREVTVGDAVNVLALAWRSDMLRLSYALRWEEELPESLEFAAAALRDGYAL